ncbi:MAG: Flotillin-like protein FloA, partial [Candidatus Eremiobacteraeota bacterium]|nr:Flotillin-like protein FloA [Candidatus Eremiobacteraeota bacterium]
GVMDYYKLNNVKADTEMRGAIGQGMGADGGAPVTPAGPQTTPV